MEEINISRSPVIILDGHAMKEPGNRKMIRRGDFVALTAGQYDPEWNEWSHIQPGLQLSQVYGLSPEFSGH